MIQRIAESITLVVAFVAGLAAVIIVLVSTFGPDFYNDRNVALATLSVVGLVAVAVSLERITVLSNLRQDIAEIDSSLRSRLGGQYLKGRKAIYSHTLSTIVGAEEEIVSVIVGSAPRAPDFWFKAIVDRLRESKKADNELMWNVYLAFPAGDERAGLAIARRMQSLEMSGVADQVHLWHVPWEENSGFDFLVVDKRHVTLTLPSQRPPQRNTEGPHRAIHFQNAPDLAKTLLDWVVHRSKEPLRASAEHTED